MADTPSPGPPGALTGAPASAARSDEESPPVAGYDRLGAREAMRGLLDLPEPLLRRLLAWEVLHRRRTQVLRAIRRALDRLAARASALRGSAGVPVAEGTAGSAASRRARVR